MEFIKSIFHLGRRSPAIAQKPAEQEGEKTSTPASVDAYSPDKPIELPTEDRFNRWPFAQRVAQTISTRKDQSSIVIGIFGVYGDGKTSTLNMMEVELRKHANVVPIRFNPWHFADQGQLIRSFFNTLADGLGKSLTGAKEKIGATLEKYGDLLVAGTPFGLDASGATKRLGRALSTIELGELRRRLEGVLRGSGKRAVVIMDDIDRLDRTEIQAVFKLVKLSADFDMTAYVLAFDKDMVAAALAEKYSASKSDDSAGHAFLEKIIQVPLNLPPAEKGALRKIAFEGVDAVLDSAAIKLDQEDVNRFVRHFIDAVEPRLTTPRMAKRYGNVIAFSVPLLKGEVDTVDLLLIEAARVFYPHLYKTIIAERDSFLGSRSLMTLREDIWKEHGKEVLERAFEGLTPNERNAAQELLEALFPRIKGITANYSYSDQYDQEWAREKRIASSNYFARYFQYAIPTGDIPDSTIQEFLAALADRDLAAVADELRGLAAGQRAERLVEKLREQEKTIDRVRAEKLALAVANVGDAFPNPPRLFQPLTSFGQAAILVTNLVRRIPAGSQRDDFARRIIEEAQPVLFAVECLQWFRKTKDQAEEERLIGEATQRDVEQVCARRVGEAARENAPHLTDPDNASRLYAIWFSFGDKRELSDYLKRRIEQDHAESAKFICCFLPTAWGGESGLPHKSNLTREGYDSISALMEPEALIGHLKAVFGESVEEAKESADRELSVEERAAREFIRIHRAFQEKNDASQTGPGSAATQEP